ncbi:MAG: glycosyltransferase [Anaerolineae bacterium]|nr:glycosyltransferase [Anaerolineae bacterium]
MPKISVIIPSYNHANFINEAIQSVLSQSISDLELIIVDDGSSDDSLNVLKTINDSRVRIITQQNQGAHAAINRGITESTGQYLAILNSDDVYHSLRLEKLLNLLETKQEVGLVSSHIKIIDQNGTEKGIKKGYETLSPWTLSAPRKSFRAGQELKAVLLTENYLATTSNFIFERKIFEQIGAFLPLRYTHDWDFALRVAEVKQIALLPEVLLNYRVHGSNTIRENKAAMIFEICWCLAVHLPRHTSAAWFLAQPLDIRIEQLLHSIYVFGLEQVLNVMLLLQLYENHQLALQLLEINNPSRLKILEFIQSQLKSQSILTSQQNNHQQVIPSPASSVKAWVGRLISNLKI